VILLLDPFLPSWSNDLDYLTLECVHVLGYPLEKFRKDGLTPTNTFSYVCLVHSSTDLARQSSPTIADMTQKNDNTKIAIVTFRSVACDLTRPRYTSIEPTLKSSSLARSRTRTAR